MIMPRDRVHIGISYELKKLAELKNIDWAKALEFGVKAELAERKLKLGLSMAEVYEEYPDCSLLRKYMVLAGKQAEAGLK